MLKKALIGAILLPFMAAPGLAQDQSGDHHYSGGANSNVPHHIGPRATSKTRKSEGTPSQAGQHHYQGGPQSIYHIGNLPNATGDVPKRKKVKRTKKQSS